MVSSETTEPRPRTLWVRSLQTAGVLAVLASNLLGLGLAFLVFGMRCDEGCDPTPSSWRHDSDAWQWDAQFALALLGLAAAAVTVAAVIRLDRRGIYTAVVSATAWAAWWVWVSA